MLHALGVPMQAKAFQLGLRIEQPQEQVNCHKYGRSDYLQQLGSGLHFGGSWAVRSVYVLYVCRRAYLFRASRSQTCFARMA